MNKEIKAEDIGRIIYWWRRYKGIKHLDAKGGKFYTFSDLDLLENRIKEYFKYPKRFNFDKPEMDIEY